MRQAVGLQMEERSGNPGRCRWAGMKEAVGLGGGLIPQLRWLTLATKKAKKKRGFDMNTLPFTVRGVLTDLVDLVGIVRLEEHELCLEFRTEHPLSKFFQSNAREIHIPLADLEEVGFKTRFCIGFLTLRARRMTAFNPVPGNHGGELRLRCRREHWDTARELASRLNMHTVRQELNALVAATNRTREVLPQEPAPGGPENLRPKPKGLAPQAEA
jgi:hypothetical protein